MKSVYRLIFAGLVMAGLPSAPALGGSLQLKVPLQDARLDRLQPQVKVPGGVATALRPNCPNPAVRALDANVIRRSGSQATVRFTAVVENMGRVAYVSRPGQQGFTLSRDTSGRVASVVARRDFPRLNPGQRVTLSWTQTISRYGYGEFPPVFLAAIGYDPDIRLDSNPANDDCRGTDNRRTLNGQIVNAMLSR